jgi:hypothetical protein
MGGAFATSGIGMMDRLGILFDPSGRPAGGVRLET